MDSERKGIYEQVIFRKGPEHQIWVAVEECSELIDSLAKLHRGRCSKEDVITEIADVSVMIDQLSIIFGEEKVEQEKDRKLARLSERLNTDHDL